MKSLDGRIIQLLPYEQSLSDVFVCNPDVFNLDIHFRIPDEAGPEHLRLLNISEIVDGNTSENIDSISGTQLGLCWIDIDANWLNHETGMHIYRFEFVNTVTNDIFHLYGTYRVYNDIPIKPYIYMDRK